jgi:hypothetical protein
MCAPRTTNSPRAGEVADGPELSCAKVRLGNRLAAPSAVVAVSIVRRLIPFLVPFLRIVPLPRFSRVEREVEGLKSRRPLMKASAHQIEKSIGAALPTLLPTPMVLQFRKWRHQTAGGRRHDDI